jgi:serine/threonine protein kinase
VSRRLPSEPPVLAGYSYLRALGKGGFADVFLYEQALPRGEVAIKVLLPGLANNRVREMFLSEANLMSQLKTHPSVVTVHTASIAADGRPYLVMEHCPASFGNRYRTERISVAEVLRAGIKIGSALESAHRLGFLHRDIKPSNILITQYNHPVLADFGIASTVAESEREEAEGMSVPWSAPEVLNGTTRGTVQSEVFSLGATLYTLLAGRTPFEFPGKSNTRDDIHRRIIGRESVPPTGRPDVPRDLDDALADALNKDPSHRPASVLAFVRSLQLIESEMGLPQTAVEVANDAPAVITRPITGADALPDSFKQGVSTRKPGEGRIRHRGRTAEAGHEATDSSVTVIRPVEVNHRDRSSRKGRGLIWAVALSSAVVVSAIVVVAVLLLSRGGSSDLPTVSNITATVVGDSARFSWQDPGLAEKDVYAISANDGTTSTQTGTTFTLQKSDSTRACISVKVGRAGKTGEQSAEKCVEFSGTEQ